MRRDPDFGFAPSTYLQWVDAEGIMLLNALAEAGAQLRGVSSYIALLLGHSS